jgi:hypothetical protein
MGSNPINLAIRFLLEITALVAMGTWGWKLSDSWLRFILAVGVPVIAAAIWGVFAVADDPSRSGQAPVPVPGMIRLAIEFAFFAFAAWIFNSLGFTRPSWIFGVIVIIHYVISYDRIMWLLTR